MATDQTLRVTYAKAVHDDAETARVVAVLNEHRTLMGRETNEFEKRVAELFGRKYAVMVNSGSSANYLAFELLDLPEGSEVITPILTFSTTIAPLVRRRLVPVFADVDEGKYTINVSQVEKLITKKTKALMVPLLLGNVPDMKRLAAIAKKHKLYFIEDSCDTFAARFNGKPTSKFTDITTTSFYGSHIITAGGGGGMLMFDKPKWRDLAKVLRGWGRSSSIFGESEDIAIRFKAKLGKIPYDAKFIFSQPGYNFLPVEMCSAFGNVQLDKLEEFRKIREHNFRHLQQFFARYNEYFILPIQEPNVETWWIAFPLTLTKKAPFTRIELMAYLEQHNIQTRPIFTGNILKQPGFKKIPHRTIPRYRYSVTQSVMERGLLIGCHHGMDKQHLEKIESVITSFIKEKS